MRLLTTVLASLLTAHVFACTNIAIKATDGSVVVGRTLEFGPSLKTQIMTSNRDRQFSNKAPNGKDSYSWKAKYGFVYMNYFGVNEPVDGINEKGLSIGLLYMPGYAKYADVPADPSKAMPYYQFPDWILSSFSTVAEAKQAIPNMVVFTQAQTVQGQQPTVFPLHCVITDATGKSITVEWINGKVEVTDNPASILTNSPSFGWHLTNLKNYANLSPYSPSEIKIGKYTYNGLGQGAGSVGLPGDPTPPSRFVKTAFLAANATPVDNATDALVLVQHILNNVDLPKGYVRGPQNDKDAPMDITQWTVFKDLTNKVLYFKSYDYPTLRSIDLTKIDFSAKAPTLSLPITSPAPQSVDVTSTYLKSKN